MVLIVVLLWLLVFCLLLQKHKVPKTHEGDYPKRYKYPAGTYYNNDYDNNNNNDE